MNVLEEYDKKHGYTWTVTARDPEVPPLEIFWCHKKLAIRQENPDQVDLIDLDLGQTYDLLKALARALDVGPEGI